MEVDVINLFEYFIRTLEQDLTPTNIIAGIKENDELLNASNSYCEQCGNCCNARCANKEERDGLVFCTLHHENYPNGKSIADYGAIIKEHNPQYWAKPLTCHTSGPHLGFLGIVHVLKTRGDIRLEEILDLCPGGKQMVYDFRKFLKKR